MIPSCKICRINKYSTSIRQQFEYFKPKNIPKYNFFQTSKSTPSYEYFEPCGRSQLWSFLDYVYWKTFSSDDNLLVKRFCKQSSISLLVCNSLVACWRLEWLCDFQWFRKTLVSDTFVDQVTNIFLNNRTATLCLFDQTVFFQSLENFDAESVIPMINNIMTERDKNDDGYLDYYEYRLLQTPSK